MKPITLKLIKDTIEKNSQSDDISFKSRKREIVFLRYIYHELTREFTPSETLESVGEFINQGHDTVLHGRKMFIELVDQSVFSIAYNIYSDCRRFLIRYQDNYRYFLKENDPKLKYQSLLQINREIADLISNSHNKIDYQTQNKLVQVKSELINQIQVNEVEIVR